MILNIEIKIVIISDVIIKFYVEYAWPQSILQYFDFFPKTKIKSQFDVIYGLSPFMLYFYSLSNYFFPHILLVINCYIFVYEHGLLFHSLRSMAPIYKK